MPFKTFTILPRHLIDVVDRINMGENVYGFELDLLADFVGENFAESL